MKLTLTRIFLCLKNEWRERYPSVWSPLALVFSEITMLTVYWFTAKAFAPAVTGVGDYFTFIVLGELTLILPNYFILGAARNIRVLHQEGTLEILLISPLGFSKKVSHHAFAGGLCETFRMGLLVFLALPFFNMNSISAPFAALSLLFLAIPVAMGLGLISAAIVLLFGRGERVLAAGVTLLTVLSGAYFPSSVLPSELSNVLQVLSPLTILIESVRDSLQFGFASSKFGYAALTFAVSGTVIFALGYFLLNQSAGFYGRRLKPLLFRG